MRGKRPARAEVPDKTPHLFTSPPHAGGGSEQLSAISGFAVTYQREMPHRRHRAALGQADAAMFRRPIGQTRPWKFRPPAEPPRQRREPQFEDAARTAFGADVIDQNELAAGFQHPDEIIKRGF